MRITGHSLGGAMGTLCFADLASKFPRLALALHTFGSPRVGNPAFGTYLDGLDGQIWRVVHKRDVVT